MKKKLLKLVIIIFILLVSNSIVYANEKIILPEKKPIINEEQKSKKISNYLIPQKKPAPISEEVKPKKIKKLLVNGEIVPRNKPLVVKTKKSIRAKKSKYYSKKDYGIAKKAIKSMEQKKWSSAEKTANKARDKSIYNFIRWKHLLTTGNQLAFYEIP